KYLALGALEPRFREVLATGFGITEVTKAAVTKAVARKTRDQWVAHFAGKDACVAPVLSLGEAPANLHNRARGTFLNVGGILQPGPAPRYSRTECDPPEAPRREGADGDSIQAELGYGAAEIAGLRSRGVIV